MNIIDGRNIGAGHEQLDRLETGHQIAHAGKKSEARVNQTAHD
jgi:hypothetical protein